MSDKKEKGKPKRERVRVGSVSLPFYKWTDPRSAGEYWRWSWKDQDGKWKYGTRADREEALEAARARARTINNGKLDLEAITAAQADLVRQFLALNPTSADLDLIRDSRKATGGTVTEAVAAWHAYKLAELSGKESPHLRSEKQWLEKMGQKLTGPAASLTSEVLRKYIETASESQKSRKNARARVVALWRFARIHRIFASEEAEKLPKYKNPVGEPIAIWTPDELRTLIGGCPPDFLPWLVFSAFSGLRSEEILPKAGTKPPLTWEMVKRGQKVIEVPAAISKVRKRRLVPITPTLEKWLDHLDPPKSGPVCQIQPFEHVTKTKTLGALVGGWRKNALRHSYGSYRAASTKDLTALAIEMGTSHAMIEKHYREAVSEEVAEDYWKILPIG